MAKSPPPLPPRPCPPRPAPRVVAPVVEEIELELELDDEESLAQTVERPSPLDHARHVESRISTERMPNVTAMARTAAPPPSVSGPSSIAPVALDVAPPQEAPTPPLPISDRPSRTIDRRWMAGGAAVLFACLLAALVGVRLASAPSRVQASAVGARAPRVGILAAAREELVVPPEMAPAKAEEPAKPVVKRAVRKRAAASAPAPVLASRPSGFGHLGSDRH
jgi:hypothetical protein